MKLRILVLTLVLANIVLFVWGWTHSGLLRAPDAAVTQPLQRQIRPDALQLEPQAPQQVGVATARRR